MPIRVAVLDDYQQVAGEFADWAGRLPDARVEFFPEHIADEDALAAALAEAEVVVAMRERTAFPRRLFERLPALRLLVTTGMVNAAVDLEAAAEAGVTVCGTRSHPSGTTELTWALILGLVRGTAAEDGRVRSGGWQQTLAPDLDGQVLGIAGLGRLGSKVAAVGSAFGMDVAAWSPNLTAERAAEHGARLVGKEELFATAKVVTLHLVLSERTRGVVGDPELSVMRPDAYLVNTSRFGLLDEEALRRALASDRPAGVGLDVFPQEPLPAGHWLRTAPRTLLTPHMGYVTERTYRIFFGDVVEDIAAFLAGDPVRVI
ncbi:D-2-hydroxyacid dehydrogenase family protein [Actinacidiphila yeochonensis]|uniref:D-2-hydroxyacid dehydrogenase family protein n=1 Tax=Actinacidiphila yeochonensis TaxID=89050 RepID=UPI00056152B9|nr:D-2-hydroxyacid dehydrogenase family protein [Actinacidiphila yeochonensis]